MGGVAYSFEVMPEITQYQHIHKVGMEVPLLGIGEIGENPRQVSDYVPATMV